MEAIMEEAKSSSISLPLSPITLVSKISVYPDQPSTLGRLNLSVFDIPMLAFPYIQWGLVFFAQPLLPSSDLLGLLRSSLSRALSFYPPLAGRLSTDPDGSFFVSCNDAGVDFVHAVAPGLSLADVAVHDSDLSAVNKELFLLNGVVGFEERSSSIAAVQVTELADGVFVGCSINHTVVDGTSFWNFINAWSELSRGVERISRPPDFRRSFLDYPPPVPPSIPAAGGARAGSAASPIRNRVFRFSGKAIQDLKARANLMAGTIEREISSLQALCSQLWRSVTRARKLSPGTETVLLVPANCRNRMEPPLGTHYFGNAVLPVATVAKAEDLVGRDLGWCAQLLHRSVEEFREGAVRKEAENWMDAIDRPLRNSSGSFVVVASSPRFTVYENDMGWGRPVAVLSGPAYKVDGGAWALPSREGGGSIDLEVCLAPETMTGLLSDGEFMQYTTP